MPSQPVDINALGTPTDNDWREFRHPSRLPFLPQSTKFVRRINGQEAIVAREVPPGTDVVPGSIADHPHSLRSTLYVNGEYHGVVGDNFSSMQGICADLALVEMQLRCPPERRRFTNPVRHGGSGHLYSERINNFK